MGIFYSTLIGVWLLYLMLNKIFAFEYIYMNLKHSALDVCKGVGLLAQYLFVLFAC